MNMNAVMRYVNTHIESRVTLQEAADYAGYSVWHFCEKFKAYTGCTFNKYINHKLMQVAVRDLLNGERMVDVAERLGYTSLNGFKKAFLKEMGVYPSQYIESEHELAEQYANRRRLVTVSGRCELLKIDVLSGSQSTRMKGQRLYWYVTAAAAAEGLPRIERATRAVCAVIDRAKPLIFDNELIVGYNYADDVVETIIPFPFSQNDENEYRAYLRGGSLSSDEINQLMELLRSGWFRPECVLNTFPYAPRVSMPDELNMLWDDFAAVGFSPVNNHSIPDYRTVLEDGMEAVGLRLAAHLAAEDLNDEQRSLFESCLAVCNSVCRLGERYADYAEACADALIDGDERRRQELRGIAAVCRRVPRHPAATFREALQSVWFIHIVNTWEDGVNANSFGRLDQLLYPYYKHDTETGVLTRDEAFELLCCFFLKTYREYDVQQCTIGGCDQEGKQCVNELSYMMLDAMELLDVSRCLSLRYGRQTDRAFLRRAFEVLRYAQKGMPLFVNDDTVIPALASHGIAPADAADYAVIGCCELSIPGRSNNHSTSAQVNLLKAIEYAFCGGKSMMSGRQVSLLTDPCADMRTFRSFTDCVKQHVGYMIRRAADMTDAHIPSIREQAHLPVKTLLTQGCTESGRDYTDAGAAYNYYLMMMIGFPNLIDSLMAVKTVVFDENLLTLSDLKNELKKNLSGGIRKILLEQCPKFGNDIAEVNNLSREMFSFICGCTDSLTACDGGRFFAQFFSYTNMMSFGRHTAATPDGRLCGEMISDSIAPMVGRDFAGFSSCLSSVCKLPVREAAGSVTAVVDIDPYLCTENNLDRLLEIFAEAPADGPGCTAFNVIDKHLLMDAVRNPDEYSDLVVNVSGFSVKFCSLSRELQLYIISRTKQITL